MEIDVKTVKEIAENIEKYNLQEVTVESEGTKITLKREIAAPNFAPANEAVTHAYVPTAKPVSSKPAEIPAVDNYEAVVSPMTGTFYGSPAPGAQAFVKEGQDVKEGDTLCIVEAMKLMNEIKAHRDGKIAKIVVKDGTPVVKGEKLFLID